MSEAKKKIALSGIVAGETSICTVGKEGVGLTYRGYTIEDLAAHAEKQTDAVIATLPAEFPDQLVTSVRVVIKSRAGLLANANGATTDA